MKGNGEYSCQIGAVLQSGDIWKTLGRRLEDRLEVTWKMLECRLTWPDNEGPTGNLFRLDEKG